MAPESPHNLDDEKAVLASVLRNRDAIVPIAPWLNTEHFYLERHGWVYAAMLECFKARVTPSYINVAAELEKSNRLQAIGGIEKLIELTDAVVSSYDVEAYARRVVNYKVLRQGIAAGGKIAAMFYNRAGNGEALLADALKLLSEIKVSSADDVFVPIEQAVDAYYRKLTRVQNGEQNALGITMGYRDLDEITGGLHEDEFTIIAARPAVGKTSLMLSMAYNIAKRNDADVLIASLEMSTDQLLTRLLAMATRIDTHRLRMFHLNERETEAVIEASGLLAAFPVFIADISAMTAEQIRLASIRHRSKHERPIITIVDYLQLMGSTKKRENRVQDVSDISRGLKNLARELHVPVIALSQLSRAVEGRTSHVPMLSDLRESGSLEQDADNVWMLYREELYDQETDRKGIAELHIAKHRQGPIGVVPLRFDAATTRFDDLAPEWREPEGY